MYGHFTYIPYYLVLYMQTSVDGRRQHLRRRAEETGTLLGELCYRTKCRPEEVASYLKTQY